MIEITPKIEMDFFSVGADPVTLLEFEDDLTDDLGVNDLVVSVSGHVFVDGLFGRAIRIKDGAIVGTDGDAVGIDIDADDDLTVAYKIKRLQAPASNRAMIQKFTGGKGWLVQNLANGGVTLLIDDGADQTGASSAPGAISDDVRWHSVVHTVDRIANRMVTYVDGAVSGTNEDISDVGDCTVASPLFIYSQADETEFDLDQVAIEKAVWTPEQVFAYHHSFTPTPTGVAILSSGWVDVSEDVVGKVTAEWGIHGSSPKDRVADVGTMSFELDNSAENSAGIRGYYSPDHADARSGFAIGTSARLVLSTPLLGEKVKWVGTIESARPLPGARRPTTVVNCVDWMDEAARAKLSGLPVQVDVQSDALFGTLATAVDRPPPGGIRVGSGSDIYQFALDNVQDEGGRVSGELQKLAMSEFGYVFVTAGELVFEGRKRRSGGGAVRWAMSEDVQILRLAVSRGRDDIINRVQVSIHPRRRDTAATTVLFTLGSAVEIQRNTSVTINCPYSDPNQQAQRVGGVDMVAPVPSTDYSFNTAEDGTGVDITAQLSIASAFGGNTASLVITNDGPNDGFIPAEGLQLRGRGLYDFEPVISDRRDQASVDVFGENVFGYDMPHQSRPTNAVDLAQFILDLFSDPTTRAETVEFLANWSDEAAENAFNLEISEQVSIDSPTLGLAAVPYFVNGWKLEVEPAGLVHVTWDLAPVDLSQYWILEVDGRTELDETTILGYGLFVAGWKLDESELGTDTFLN